MGQCLSTAKLGLRRSNRTGCSEDRSVSFEHGKAGFLIGKPLQSRERDKAIGADDYKSLQSMADTRKSELATLGANAVLDFEVSSLYADLDAIAEESQDTAAIDRRFADWVFLR
jgi:hypothetical protein